MENIGTIISGFYRDRVSYPTSTLATGRYWYQYDTIDTGNGTTSLQGYYFWNGSAWIYGEFGGTDNITIYRAFPTLFLEDSLPTTIRRHFIQGNSGGTQLSIGDDVFAGGSPHVAVIVQTDPSSPLIVLGTNTNGATTQGIINQAVGGFRRSELRLLLSDTATPNKANWGILADSNSDPTIDEKFSIVDWIKNTIRFAINSAGSVIIGDSTNALATNATDGFLYIPTCAGTPTGVPNAINGVKPIVYDTSANKIWIYNGAWRGVVVA